MAKYDENYNSYGTGKTQSQPAIRKVHT